MQRHFLLSFGCIVALAVEAHAQLEPGIGYIYPPGGQVGTTVEVVLGGYDWTPDVDLFVRQPGVTLEKSGTLGPVLVDPPPYWFGKKGRGEAFPQAREQPARLTLPAGLPPGIIRWQVANANGVSASGKFYVSAEPVVREAVLHRGPQELPSLPVVVCGQITKIEEIDQYRFTAPQAGPITCRIQARELGSPLNAIVKIHDAAGRLVADAADTEGNDTSLTFVAVAGEQYTLSLHDLDFRGTRSYVYRLSIAAGPRVVATIPAVGRRGETRDVQFIGYGVATGSAQLEMLNRSVTFPADPQAKWLDLALETPHGIAAPFRIPLADVADALEPASTDIAARQLTLPAALTAVFETRFAQERYRCQGKQGDVWSISAAARPYGSPLDLSLAILDGEGKELARNDDLPGTTDAGLLFTLPADGAYDIAVEDGSGKSGTPLSTYRLVVGPAVPDFEIEAAELVGVLMGGKAQLAVKVNRRDGFKEPITLAVAGLPAGVTAGEKLEVPAGAAAFSIPLACAENVPSVAAMITVSGTAKVGEAAVTRTGEPTLLATVMKPVVVVEAEGKDDVRKVDRGTTYPAPLLVERLNGFTGPFVLEMTAKQQRHRQGIYGGEVVVPAGATTAIYPTFLPEWLETTKTSRMICNAVAKVHDAAGRERYLVSKMPNRIGILPGGNILRLEHHAGELRVPWGQALEIPIALIRAAKLPQPATIELHLDEYLQGALTAEPLTLGPGQASGTVRIVPSANAAAAAGQQLGEHRLTLRATALENGQWPVVSETEVVVEFLPAE